VIDPTARELTDRVFFGATVTLADEDARRTPTASSESTKRTSRAGASRGSLRSRAPLLKRQEGEQFTFKAPGGDQLLEIVRVEYLPID